MGVEGTERSPKHPSVDRDTVLGVETSSLDRRGVAWGAVAVAIVIALTFVGSDGLAWFDAALVGYLFGLIFAVFGVVYRYAVWVRRPPTAMLNRRGWDAFRQRQSRQPGCPPWTRRHPTAWSLTFLGLVHSGVRAVRRAGAS